MSKWKIAGIIIAVVAIALSLINASWLAPTPTGKLVLIAQRGVAQQYDRTGIDNETCTASRLLPIEHNFIENTVRSIQQAFLLGAGAAAIQVAPTKDGRMVVFHDWTLDCRTNGKGNVRDHTLAELKALDIGYGYTADGGKTFPLRGRGVGAMPSVEDVLRAFPDQSLIFIFKSRNPREADLLMAEFARTGVRVDQKYGFGGDPRITRRVRQLAPGAWTYDKVGARACATDYLKFGWTSHIPASCRNTTVIVPLNYQWAVWGWPNRFLDRMASANTKVMVTGPTDGGGFAGIQRPEQLGDVPRSFRGYLMVEDIYSVGRSLRR